MIDSIIANKFQDWELFAIDDGSTEETREHLKRFEGNPRIHFIQRSREPKGAQTCRNIGLEMAQGEYIIFFDSDDIVTPNCLKNRVEQLQQHPELDFMVFRSGTAITKDGKTLFEPSPTNLTFGYSIYKDDIEAFCTRFLPFVVWNNIYRRKSLIDHHIIWDTKLLSLQDSMFNLQCLLSGLKYHYSETPPDYGYRTETQGSISKKIMSQEHFNSNIYATERFYTLIKNKFGNKYDHSLYRGAMFVYVKISRTGFQADFNNKLANTISRFSAVWGNVFKFQVFLTHIFSKIMPLTLARRIPILNYLIWYRFREKWVVQKQKELQ